MIPVDNNPAAQPAAAPDGKKPSFGKRFLDRVKDSKSTESSSAPNNPATRFMELTAPDGKKPAAVKRLLGRLGVSKSTKSSLVSSTAATQSVGNVTAPASAAQPAANIFGKPVHHFFTITQRRPPRVVTAPAVPGAAASVQVVTYMDAISATNVDQGGSIPPAAAVSTSAAINLDQRDSVTPAAAGPTSAMNINQRGSVTTVASRPLSTMNADQRRSMTPAVVGPTSAMNINQRSSMPKVVVSHNNPTTNPVSLTNINQLSPPGPNVPQVQSKSKEGMNIALDGFLTALRAAKDSADWNPFLKAALGGVVAVIDLAKVVSDNSQNMNDTLVRIQGLLPILETSAKRLEGRKDGFGKGNNLMTFAITIQAELEKIQEMQLHGLFRRVLQGPKDAGILLGVYKNISEALEQFKVVFLVAIEHDTSTIKQ
ncbi:hypothetical protein DXG01_003933, partial [Tephrocybe rancida]